MSVRRCGRTIGRCELENFLTSVPEAVKMLSVGRSTLYRLIKDGRLETVKIGRRTLIRIDSIKALAGCPEIGAIDRR
jgi:excisionase family DNA binding protein